jgi:hypothetical protein
LSGLFAQSKVEEGIMLYEPREYRKLCSELRQEKNLVRFQAIYEEIIGRLREYELMIRESDSKPWTNQGSKSDNANTILD